MALYLGDKLISSNLAGGDTNPIGSVIAFAGANAPVGYLICDGSAVSRETYYWDYSSWHKYPEQDIR